MTKDEIEKLAVEAGWPLFAIQMLAGTEDEKRLQRFADLVAKAEREACAKVCEDAISSIWEFHPEYVNQVGRNVCTNLAAAIRARGNA